MQIRNEFYADTQGVLLVYDVTNKSSFDALDSWIDEMKNEITSAADIDNIVFVVCANKVSHSDVTLQIDSEKIEAVLLSAAE